MICAHTHILSFSSPLLPTHTHTHTHTLSLSHTHTHTHVHTHTHAQHTRTTHTSQHIHTLAYCLSHAYSRRRERATRRTMVSSFWRHRPRRTSMQQKYSSLSVGSSGRPLSARFSGVPCFFVCVLPLLLSNPFPHPLVPVALLCVPSLCPFPQYAATKCKEDAHDWAAGGEEEQGPSGSSVVSFSHREGADPSSRKKGCKC